MSKILVVVDMQKNFIKQTGAEAIVAKVAEKIKRRLRENYEIVLTLDKSGGEPDGRILDACNGAKTFRKHSYGCEELISYLKDRIPDKVEFVGVCTDICVITNVLGTMAFLPFANIVVDGGCCASYRAEGHRAALRVMRACNIEVK